jgi:hypothetical protein
MRQEMVRLEESVAHEIWSLTQYCSTAEVCLLTTAQMRLIKATDFHPFKIPSSLNLSLRTMASLDVRLALSSLCSEATLYPVSNVPERNCEQDRDSERHQWRVPDEAVRCLRTSPNVHTEDPSDERQWNIDER